MPDDPQREEPTLRTEAPAVLGMAALFTVSVALALVAAPTFTAQGAQAFEDPQDPVNPLIYLGIVVAFTALVLVVARLRGGQRVIQALFLLAVLGTLVYVLDPLLNLLLAPGPAFLLALAAAVVLTTLILFYPEWYVIDAVGVTVAAGAASIFGISFGLVPSLLLLVVFAVYDAISVYQTGHMLDLADNVLQLRLPIMLVVPKTRSYSFLEATESLEDRPSPFLVTDAEGREARLVPRLDDDAGLSDAMFLGLGDIVIPAVLVVSAFSFLPATPAVLGLAGNLVVALATLAGALVGFGVLMTLVITGRPQAGLPSLNGGAILGFLLAMVPLFGWAPLLPVLVL